MHRAFQLGSAAWFEDADLRPSAQSLSSGVDAGAAPADTSVSSWTALCSLDTRSPALGYRNRDTYKVYIDPPTSLSSTTSTQTLVRIGNDVGLLVRVRVGDAVHRDLA